MATANNNSNDDKLPEVVVTGTDTEDNRPNKRQYNPLSKFSSVTYQLAFYALTPDAFNDFYANDRWILTPNNSELIVQSGGKSTLQRSSFFDLDLYIDDLEMKTKMAASELRFPSNTTDITFKIYEPYGVTFTSKIVAMQEKLAQNASIKQQIDMQSKISVAPYLLVIRFYGYDKDGKLITKPVDEGQSADATKTDSSAAFERAFPVMIQNIKFKIDGKTTVYDVLCRPLSEQVGFSIRRGKINENLTIVADTVGNAIGGNEKYPASARGTKGLVDMLNAYQTQQVNIGNRKIPDVYKIVYEEESNIPTSILADTDYVKQYAPTVGVENATQVNARTAFLKTTVFNKQNRELKVASGTPITQAIEQIITQSSYMKDALTTLDIEKNQPTQVNDKETIEKKPVKPFEWFLVKPITKIIDWDPNINDNAYEITYVIKKYQVPYLRSLYIGNYTPYYGPHKIYEYNYTGQNSEILDYTVNFNFGYYNNQVMGSEAPAVIGDPTAPRAAEAASNSNPTGMLPGKREIYNAVRSSFYSPADQLKAKIKILGDPDYLMPVEFGTISQVLKNFYGPDFSINALGGYVYIEIGFNLVDDYNNTDGLMKIKPSFQYARHWIYPEEIEAVVNGRMIYRILEIRSTFKAGVFTQDLSTVLPSFNAQSEKVTKTSNASTFTTGVNDQGTNQTPTTYNNASIVSNQSSSYGPPTQSTSNPTQPSTGITTTTVNDDSGGAI